MQTNLDDDEEDFLALVGSKRGSVNVNDTDSVATARINSSFSQIPAVDHVELSPRATNQASPAQQSHSELPSFEDFKDALQEFYATYNFGNLEKVPYLAERFFFRRWDLWRQLSIKYRLSPRESANLWIRFNVKFDGIPECARRLFDSPETVQISSDSLEERRKIWIKLLAISSDSQREQYDKHVLEVSKSGQVDDQANNCIRIDVVRTHQELSFFQEDANRNAMVEILSAYCTLNGIEYVQGMNELLGVIFYVNRDSSDSFWAFNSLMSQLSDIFTAEVDSTEGGIYSRIDEIRRLLGDYDYKLSKRLEKSDFPFATICLRWLTTMMAFDLTLPDTMHLWDIALQAIPSHDLVRFTSCICAAYLMQTSGMVYTLHDDQDVIQTISGFGKSCAFDIDDLVTRSLAVYAFESTLRGQYVPNSDEPVLEALGEAVESATNKVLSVIESVNADQVREEVQEKMSKARDFVTSVNTEKVQEKLTQARIFVSSWLSGFATPPKIDDTTTQQDEVPDDKNQQKQS